jgi:hypothetical protein
MPPVYRPSLPSLCSQLCSEPVIYESTPAVSSSAASWCRLVWCFRVPITCRSGQVSALQVRVSRNVGLHRSTVPLPVVARLDSDVEGPGPWVALRQVGQEWDGPVTGNCTTAPIPAGIAWTRGAPLGPSREYPIILRSFARAFSKGGLGVSGDSGWRVLVRVRAEGPGPTARGTSRMPVAVYSSSEQMRDTAATGHTQPHTEGADCHPGQQPVRPAHHSSPTRASRQFAETALDMVGQQTHKPTVLPVHSPSHKASA